MNTEAGFYSRIRNLWHRAVAPVCAAAILGAALSLAPQPAGAASQEDIDAALAAGIAWSASQQAVDGGWSATTYVDSRRDLGTTGLAVTALGHYAEHLGKDPLGDDYQYRDNILDGLDYIFSHANTRYDAANNRVWFGGVAISGSDNYVAGPVLMAIVMTDAPDRVVAGGVLDGLTYAEVVQGIINYLDHNQIKAGNGKGSWGYTGQSSDGDMSIAGFVTLGLGYAKDRFPGIIFPEDGTEKTMLDYLDEGIQYMQWTEDPLDPRYGGSGYTSWGAVPYDNWINIYKVGHLLYIMDLVGDDVDTPRVQTSLDFLRRHWNAPNSGDNGYPSTVNNYIDVGWRGGPGDPPNPLPSYIATVTTMKALVDLGLVNLAGVYDVPGDPDGGTSPIDWFDDFSDVIVANQHADGYWEQGGYPTHYLPNLDTQFALLTLLRAAPEDPVVDPDLPNPVKRPPQPAAPDFPVVGTVTLDVTGTGATFLQARRLNIGHGGAVKTGTIELPVGGFDFTIDLPAAGACVVMKLTPPAGALNPANPNGFLDADGNIKAGLNWFKIQGGAWRGLATVPISLKPDGGPYTEIWVELCDGGPEDASGIVNGRIVDPGAPGFGAAADAPPVAPFGGTSTGCFINTVSP